MANLSISMSHYGKLGHRTLAVLLLFASPCLLAQEIQPTTSDTINQHIRLLQESKRATVRRDAVRQLSGQPGPTIDQALLSAIDDSDSGVREAAIYHFLKLRQPLPESLLRKAAQDRSANVREAAIWTLKTLYPAQHSGTVAAALRDSAPGVRTAAIWAAGDFNLGVEPEMYSQVVKLFDRCFSKECNAIIWVLLKHDDRLPDPVRSRLLDKLSAVKATAAEAIGLSAASGELETLRALAIDSVPLVRTAAANALGALAGKPDDGGTEALLLRLLGDESFIVRQAAADALERRGFVAPRRILDFIEGKTDDSPWVAHLDRKNIAPILMGLWEDLQGAERRRLACLLMTWRYEPAVEVGLALVASRSLLDRMAGWRGLTSHWKWAYLGRAALATLTSPFTWLYLLLVAAVVSWSIWTRNNLRGFLSNHPG